MIERAQRTVSRLIGSHAVTALACTVLSAILLLFCSQSSPLYPLNLWGDANCLFTVGRVMRAGGVLYRDIYEQKGPTLYALHALAALISDTDFLGVYVIETLALAAALFFAVLTLQRRMSRVASLSCAALLFSLVLTSPSFCQGDSAEELCLPLLTAAVYAALTGRRSGPMRASRLFFCGVLSGLVATVKYTLLGAFIGLCLWEGALCLFSDSAAWRARVMRLLGHGCAFLTGMALPITLWCVYFAANGALGDFYTAYIYNNIFLYHADGSDSLRELLALLRDNALWGLPTALGLLCFLCAGKERGPVRAQVLGMAAFAAISSLFLGRLWRYSPLALAAFGPVGILGLSDALTRVNHRMRAVRTKKAGLRVALCAACLALAMGVAWHSPNAYLRGVSKDELAQGRLAERIETGATLLQYSHLDDGLYLTAGILPEEKYFVRLNVRAPEMIKALDACVQEGRPDYVLVSWRTLPETFTRYTLVAQDVAYDDAGRLNKMLYLYHRIDAQP